MLAYIYINQFIVNSEHWYATTRPNEAYITAHSHRPTSHAVQAFTLRTIKETNLTYCSPQTGSPYNRYTFLPSNTPQSIWHLGGEMIILSVAIGEVSIPVPMILGIHCI